MDKVLEQPRSSQPEIKKSYSDQLVILHLMSRAPNSEQFRPFQNTQELPEPHDYETDVKAIKVHSTKVQNGIEEYWKFLADVPVVSMLIFCVESPDCGPANTVDRDHYRPRLNRLLETRLLPLMREKGKLLLLGEFQRYEHFRIIEEIRSLKKYSLLAREELVSCYTQLTYDLARFTFGMIQPVIDPDRQRTEQNTIKYDLFIEFIQFLSARDVLIAKLLYFGAPSIESVILLKTEDIDLARSSISFDGKVVNFPKHLISDLHEQAKSRWGTNDLVFVNVRGEAVERTHLINTFARVSSKLSSGIKITPSTLLK